VTLGLTATARNCSAASESCASGRSLGLVSRLQSNLVGGGEALNQDVLTGSEPLLALAGLIALRSLVGPFFHAAGTPDWLFAPAVREPTPQKPPTGSPLGKEHRP